MLSARPTIVRTTAVTWLSFSFKVFDHLHQFLEDEQGAVTLDASSIFDTKSAAIRSDYDMSKAISMSKWKTHQGLVRLYEPMDFLL